MSNAIAKPENLQDVIREKVRTMIFDLIPEDQINNLIEKEYQSFFQPMKDSWGRESAESKFSSMVNGIITEHLNTTIRAKIIALTEQEYNENSECEWEVLESTTKRLAPLVLEGMIKSMTNSIVDSIRSQLNNF